MSETAEQNIARIMHEQNVGRTTAEHVHASEKRIEAMLAAGHPTRTEQDELAAPPAPVDAVNELGAVARAHPSTYINLNRDGEFILTCGGENCDWKLTVPQGTHLDARGEHSRHAGEQLHAAVLRAGYVLADHTEYAADHAHAGLDVVDEDEGELFTDRDDFMAAYETYRGVTLLQRTVGPWETIEVRPGGDL